MTDLSFLRLIFQLKLTLLRRHFGRNWMNLIALGLAVVVVLLLAIAGGITLSALIRIHGSEMRESAFLWSAWIITLIWIGVPLLQVDTQRSLDLSALRLYPVTRLQFTLALLLDSALSPAGLLVLPLLGAMACALPADIIELPFVLLSLLLLLGCLLALGQAITLWGNRLFSSRRYADASLIVGFLIFLLLQMLNLGLQRAAFLESSPLLSALLDSLRTLGAPLGQWLFPGLASRALSQIAEGQLAGALGLYGLLGLELLVLCWLASLAGRQFYEGELESGGQAQRSTLLRRRRSYGGPGLLRAELSALLMRERIYLLRDPVLKMLFIQTLFWAIYLLGMLLFMRMAGGLSLPDGSSIAGYIVLGLALTLCYSESSVLFNKFGSEGAQLAGTLLTPVARRDLLLAKGLLFLSCFVPVNCLLLLIVALTLKAPLLYLAGGLLLVVTGMLLVDHAGNFISVLMPFTYRRQGSKIRAVMPQPGCAYLLIYALVFQLANLAVLPAALAVGLGIAYLGWAGLAVALLVCLLLVGLAHYIALPWAARLFSERESQMLEMLSRSAD